MCGRYVLLNTTEKKIVEKFGKLRLDGFETVDGSYNVAPSQLKPVITYVEKYQTRQLQLMKWGLVPGYEKDLQKARKPINLRGETVAAKFKRNFAERRCLIPVDGFYEWHAKTRDPYFIRVKGEAPFAFAGVWASWHPPAGSHLHTYAILTAEPNPLIAPIHNRMPVIVDPDDYQKWLSASTSIDVAQAMLKPFPADKMEAWQVTKAVGNVRNNSRENIVPLNGVEAR